MFVCGKDEGTALSSLRCSLNILGPGLPTVIGCEMGKNCGISQCEAVSPKVHLSTPQKVNKKS